MTGPACSWQPSAAHRGVIFDALRTVLGLPELYEAQKKPFRNALKALGGEEEGGDRG